MYRFFKRVVILAFVLSSISYQAHADAAVAASGGGVIDLNIVFQGVMTLVGAVITAAIPYIIVLIDRKLKIDQNSVQGQIIDSAIKRAGGIAYDFMASMQGKAPTVQIKNAGLAAGINHVLASIPDTLKEKGVDQATLTRMISGELGQLLAADPNVSVGDSAQATSTSVPVSVVGDKPASVVVDAGSTGKPPPVTVVTTKTV